VLQAPIDRRLVESARRLRQIRAPTGESALSERLLPVFSLGAAGLLAYGMHSAAVPDQLLPAALLKPALMLAGGGILTAVFARTALQLSCGVILVLIGFELAYTRLDPGLLITGGLASFQLLLAIVASHFLGLSPTSDAPPTP
jgi:hypothetical protein